MLCRPPHSHRLCTEEQQLWIGALRTAFVQSSSAVIALRLGNNCPSTWVAKDYLHYPILHIGQTEEYGVLRWLEALVFCLDAGIPIQTVGRAVDPQTAERFARGIEKNRELGISN